MSTFAKMRKNSLDINALVGAATAASKQESQNSGPDSRMWKPTVDKAGNGYAVIRFLPQQNAEELPWARYWDHGFKGPTGKWYIEKSLTSIGQNDPVGEMNSKLWATGLESDKQLARERKRRLHYVSNILVISDPSNPENEGKVFLFQYGKKIFDKIMDLMQPQFPDEKPINPFDFWTGADFVMKIRNVDGYRSYDKSEFKGESELLDGDETKLEAVFNKLYDLGEFTDPKQYKSYDELKKKLAEVLGERPEMSTKQAIAVEETAQPKPMKTAEAVSDDEDISTPNVDDDDEEDDTMSYFAKLAEGA